MANPQNRPEIPMPPDHAEPLPEDLQPGDPGYLTLEELLATLPGSDGWDV